MHNHPMNDLTGKHILIHPSKPPLIVCSEYPLVFNVLYCRDISLQKALKMSLDLDQTLAPPPPPAPVAEALLSSPAKSQEASQPARSGRRTLSCMASEGVAALKRKSSQTPTAVKMPVRRNQRNGKTQRTRKMRARTRHGAMMMHLRRNL